jgi:predicted  nucleic acid-binding Zn-ribbon protein
MTKVERESINFKLPKPLAAALRKAARERNTTATDLVIQGLQGILGDIPGTETSVETRLHQLETQLASGSDTRIDHSTETRLTNLEIKLETVTARIAQFESALMTVQNHLNSRSSYRTKSYAPYYNQAKAQLMPFEEKDLALRLNTSASTLQEKRATQNPKDFELWCKERDPSKYAWRFNEKDGLYHPVK